MLCIPVIFFSKYICLCTLFKTCNYSFWIIVEENHNFTIPRNPLQVKAMHFLYLTVEQLLEPVEKDVN